MVKKLIIFVFLTVVVCGCSPSGGLHRNYIISQQYDELEEDAESNQTP